MLGVTLAVLACAAVAGAVYLGRERLGPEGVGMALLRTAGLGALVLMLINPTRTARVAGGSATVLLDASLSMAAAGGRWTEALDSALSLAGESGEVLRFGVAVTPLDTLPPGDGISRIGAGLTQAGARGGPVVVVTDGELADAAALPPSLVAGATWVVLPRDTLPGAGLLEAVLPEQVAPDDSIPIRLTLGTWGALAARSATVELREGERRLLARDVELPPPPAVAQRRIVLAPGTLGRGDHVLHLRVTAAGDAEPRDDERIRVVTVSEEPAVAVIVDPPDWEGRFLVQALGEVTGSAVRGYARPDSARWVDMRTLEPVPERSVRTAARRAALLVLRGCLQATGTCGARCPRHRWPAASPGWRGIPCLLSPGWCHWLRPKKSGRRWPHARDAAAWHARCWWAPR